MFEDMFNNRKAQGMSLKIVIVAVLALIILIVLILVFTGKLKIFGQGTSETASQYSTNRCEVPGTGNECMGEYECDRAGGSWSEGPDGEGYSDCSYGGCCSM